MWHFYYYFISYINFKCARCARHVPCKRFSFEALEYIYIYKEDYEILEFPINFVPPLNWAKNHFNPNGVLEVKTIEPCHFTPLPPPPSPCSFPPNQAYFSPLFTLSPIKWALSGKKFIA